MPLKSEEAPKSPKTTPGSCFPNPGAISDKTFHHVLIASCNTDAGASEILKDFVTSLRCQDRKPTHLVILATQGGDVCDFLLETIREMLAPVGVIVMLVVMDASTGDLGALSKAVGLLQKEFESHDDREFDDAWATYLSFPSYLHPRYCQHVFKQVFFARWDSEPDMQMLMLDPKALNNNENCGKIHECVIRGRCLRLFVNSRLFRCLERQQNVFWTGMLVTFCRSPICMDDGVGVTRFGKWCDPKRPILLPSVDEEVNFEGQIGTIRRVLIAERPENPSKCVVWFDEKEREMTLFPDEFDVCFRSMMTINKKKREDRIFKFIRKLPEIDITESVMKIAMVRVETAVEAALAIGCLVEQQKVIIGAIESHLEENLNPLRSEYEKNLLTDLAKMGEEGDLHSELGFPESIPFATALVTEERRPVEIKVLAKQAPLAGPIALCRMLGIPPIEQEKIMDDGKPIPTVGAKFLSMATGTTHRPLSLYQLVENVMNESKLPLEYLKYVGMYSRIYCLSKGVVF